MKNILLITADQMRWDCLGCAGNEIIRTPNLDALAARGVRFRNAFTPDPICVPARASIMTGNYPQVCTGFKLNTGKIKDDQPLLTEILKKVGYKTYASGKLHFLPYSPPGVPRLVHGFEHVDLHESGRILGQYAKNKKMSGIEDYFDYLEEVGWGGYGRAHGVGNNDPRPCSSPLPIEHNVDYWIADCVIRNVDSHISKFPDNPFFMWMSSPKPHPPYDPPSPYDRIYDPREIPPPFGSPEDLNDRQIYMEAIRYKCGADSISPEAWKFIRSYYYGSITFLDAMIGRVIEHLDRKNLLADTLILFTADHGDLIGDFGSCFKVSQLNGSVRVPFIVSGPGIPAAEVSESLVGLQDILPTFAAFADADIEAEIQGENLMPVLRDTSKAARDYYYSTTEEYGGQSAMVTDGKFKYIYSEGNAIEELYDQVNDLPELNNLAKNPDYTEKAREMREALINCAKHFKDYNILCKNGLKASEVDRSILPKSAPGGLGWRWY